MSLAYYPTCHLRRHITLTGLHTAFCHTMKTAYTSMGEAHNFWEVVLVIDGEIAIATDRDVLRIRKNCMYLHPPMEFHRHFNPTGSQPTFAVLSFDMEGEPPSAGAIYMLSPDDVQDFLSIVQLIKENHLVDFGGPSHVDQPEPAIAQTIICRCELFLNTVFSRQTLPRKNTNHEYKRIVKFLSENTERKLTIPDIARELNMSVPNLKRVFSQNSGIGLMKYFNHLKIQRAIYLLGEGYSVREVSEQLSYSSQSAFCTAFQTMTGTPPSRYHKS